MGLKTMKYRDVICNQLTPDLILVTGCDSCGGIGLKENDVLSVSSELVGRITARVAVLEVLSLGAKIVGVTVPISNEPSPTGEGLLSGVKTCLDDFGIDVPILTSMEKNMQSSMTAMGVVVNGVAHSIKVGDFAPEDEIHIFGRPSVGGEVLEHAGDLLNAKTIMDLLVMDQVKEILPVGSQGIEKELKGMFESHGKAYGLMEGLDIDLEKSCGPASAAIVIAKKGSKFDVNIPQILIGTVL